MIEPNGSTTRVYQVWKGSNKFFLGGRFIFGPDVRSLVLTVFLIVVPVILFAVFVSQQLVHEFHHHLGNLIIAIAVVFAAYVLLLLFMTSGGDPGIIPRNAHLPEPDEEAETSHISADWTGNRGGVKYCHTCMLYRPPRCSHCSICNNCVERFDHHCPWVGQCIGKRNYRFFFMFVSSTTLLCLYVFAFCWVNLKEIMAAHGCSLWRAYLKSPVSGILILYTFIAAWFVGGLTSFHAYLICTNQTTYENFRCRYEGKGNPYSRGCVGNIREILFRRTPRSRNDFRAAVKREEGGGGAVGSSSSAGVFFPSSLSVARTSFDLEAGGKRQAVAAEEFEDIRSQIEVGVAAERCGPRPAHSIWADPLGMDHQGFTKRERVDPEEEAVRK
ncbi:unnamed protein product [Spirodela intermedia]|uniref:S-acyltransferase n=1 Tax=Spirodela intermedia TaxID=51605 RepID=A0A7I8IPZ2_SPIIN|nr:unnamed protein product [Spirodela intermedia]CAA6659644.1 unnamed protein product [Spirodela intermedia]